MKRFLVFIAVIFIILVSGNRLKALHDRPNLNKRFSITHLLRLPKEKGSNEKFTALVTVHDVKTIFRIEDKDDFYSPDNSGYYITVNDDVFLVERFSWYWERHPQYRSGSQFQDKSDRMIRRFTDYIHDSVLGFQLAFHPEKDEFNEQYHIFTTENTPSTEAEKIETERNLKILTGCFGKVFAMSIVNL